jgi:hypothetical protein
MNTRSRLSQFSPPVRLALAALLLTATLAYAATLVSGYLQLTPPSSLAPDPRELARLLFNVNRPISRIERLLESTAGEMNRGGTMRPAFTDQSLNWELLIQNMTAAQRATLLTQREAERLAILDWIRSGASRTAYENDDYELRDPAAAREITPDYFIGANDAAPYHVRLKTLIADRCVICHGESGRHDTARFIPLDTYNRLMPHLKPEATDEAARNWIIAALVAFYPLAAFTGPLFLVTSHPTRAKRVLLTLTLVSLAALTACWLAGKSHSNMIYPLLAAAGVAVLAIAVQIASTLTELIVSPPKTSASTDY